MKMKKVTYFKYGTPEVLQLIKANIPSPGGNEILVKVISSSLNAIDWKNRQGRFRFVTGWFKPKVQQGFDVSGLVEAIGHNVSDIAVGSRILGQLGNFKGGAFAEYVILRKGEYIKAPDNISFSELAGIPMAATTAWQALHTSANIKANSEVLINGGSSGVGHYAIQIAKAYGANVTAVCSKKNIKFCQSLGADLCIDYAQTDFTKELKKYDIIFDVVNNRNLKEVKNVMKGRSIYIGTTPTLTLLVSILKSRFSKKQSKFVAVNPNTKALNDIVTLVNAGKVKTMIDKVFPIEKIQDANKYSELSRTIGKVIIEVNSV